MLHIDKEIEEFRLKALGEKWEWREGQKETIKQIVEAYQSKKINTIILDAPTGSGKSIIAMCVSWILIKLQKRGYIITSQKQLQDQYENDINKFDLNWGIVKGVDNYKCSVNDEPFSLGECKIRNLDPNTMPCASDCEYLVRRQKAMISPIAVLSYSYWLIQRNYVQRNMSLLGKPAPFPMRDFVFFDEAHQTSDIVQSHFAPVVRETLHERLSDLTKFLKEKHFIHESVYNDKALQMLITKIRQTEDRKEIFELSKEIEKTFKNFNHTTEKVKKTVLERFGPTESGWNDIPRDWQKTLRTLDWIKDNHCKFEDFNENIEKIGSENIIKSHDEKSTSLRCLQQGHIVKRYLLKQAKFKIFMSATIGDPKKFMIINQIENAKYIKMGNHFDYSKSPIFFTNGLKLNWKEKEANFPRAAKLVDFIIEKIHKNEKGIIHTGSYEFANKLYVQTKFRKRLIMYNGSEEKAAAINRFLISKDKILVGPSLLEGLDMKGDQSRFQIFLKTPFLSLGDPFVKELLAKSQDWYNWKTSLACQQGTGRSVRYDGDYAATYFIDSTVVRLFRQPGLFPNYFMKRLKNINSLFKEYQT